LDLAIPNIFWMIFLFALGASVGSFLNVVVYRVPRELSIVRPGSHCTSCEHSIAWYDNLPIIAWFLLRGRCRHCGAGFSIRYAVIELFTALLFVGLFWAYFLVGVRQNMPEFTEGGWLIYIGHIVLICGLLASSLIDGEHWIIPLSISYTVAAAAIILSMIWPYWIAPPSELPPGLFTEPPPSLVPMATVKTGALGLGAVLGLGLSLFLLQFGLIKRSFADYEQEQEQGQEQEQEQKNYAKQDHAESKQPQPKDIKDEVGIDLPPNIIRGEMMREILFLAPVLAGALIFMYILTGSGAVGSWWEGVISQQKWVCGLLGSIFGFMIGGGVVWATRIGGSLAFGKEAMGLGDVHLMAAVGAMLGWTSPTFAFFLAPFMGLSWALARLIIHRTREIPYGPFLSMATVMVMLLHDVIMKYFGQAFTMPEIPNGF
jgi:leader peptidase (prepilin peptidase)/N-methyltransferase